MLLQPLPALEAAVPATWQPHADQRSSDEAYAARTQHSSDESMVRFGGVAAARGMCVLKPMSRGVQLPLNGPSILAAYNDSNSGVDSLDWCDDLWVYRRQWRPELVLR